MTKQSRILIIGAGPTGLVLAMELKRYGFESVRVVEKLDKLTTRGRALAVIPKTLEYLEDSGATELILKDAQKITRATLCRGGQKKSLDFTGLHGKYNHMTSMEQEEIEKRLIERLRAYGGEVERGVELIALNPQERMAVLKRGEKTEEYDYDLLVGADGVGSTVRQLMRFNFTGVEESRAWEQMEIGVDSRENLDLPLLLFLDDSPVLGAIPAPGNVYRVVTPSQRVEERFEELRKGYADFAIKEVKWKSEFRVGYRSSVEMFEDSVLLIGDAANVHSPVGGRGMNKGIEDAALLARALNTNEDLNIWERRRKRVDRLLVKRIRFASWLIKQRGIIGRIVSWSIFRFSDLFRLFIVRNVIQ